MKIKIRETKRNIMLGLELFNMYVVGKFFPTLAFKMSYYHHRHKFPDLNNPKDLSEIWYKKTKDGYYLNYFELADKFKVREHIINKGYGEILTPLIAHYYKSDDVDFESLPNRFALKMNFGAGMNIICQDKSRLDIVDSRRKLSSWFKVNNYNPTEKHYSLIEKCAVCEEFIDDGNGGFPIDYKFMCINGKVACILACSGRENGHANYLPYSLDWEPLYDYYDNYDKSVSPLRKPNNLNEMIECAEKLSEGIDLVRVDLYSNNERIWFGEITLTPAGCVFHRWSQKALNELGAIYLNGI